MKAFALFERRPLAILLNALQQRSVGCIPRVPEPETIAVPTAICLRCEGKHSATTKQQLNIWIVFAQSTAEHSASSVLRAAPCAHRSTRSLTLCSRWALPFHRLKTYRGQLLLLHGRWMLTHFGQSPHQKSNQNTNQVATCTGHRQVGKAQLFLTSFANRPVYEPIDPTVYSSVYYFF